MIRLTIERNTRGICRSRVVNEVIDSMTKRFFFVPPSPSLPKRYFFVFVLAHFYFPASGQAVVTGVVPSPPRFLPSIRIAHRVQQSHCSSIFHRVLLTHALALSASQLMHKRSKSLVRIHTRMDSGGLELTKLTYTRLEDNQIGHWGDRSEVTGQR